MSQTLAPLSPEIQKLITDVFSLKFTDNTNTKSLEHFTDTITPTDVRAYQIRGLVRHLSRRFRSLLTGGRSNHAQAPATTLRAMATSPCPRPLTASKRRQHYRLAGVTGSKASDTATIQIRYRDVNSGDQPTVSVKFVSLQLHGCTRSPPGAEHAAAEGCCRGRSHHHAVNQGTLLNNKGLATWTYQAADGAFDFLAANETLTLTYDGDRRQQFCAE